MEPETLVLRRENVEVCAGGMRMRIFTRKSRSLKRSLIIALLLSAVIPIVLMAMGSYYVIYLILDKKIANGVMSTLHQVQLNIEKTYDNLNYVSQQLSNNDLQSFLESNDVMERYILGQTVFKNLDLISFTNPDTGLFYYYIPSDGEIFFRNEEIRTDGNPEQFPVMTTVKEVNYYAPHPTLSFRSGQVFSLSRSINIPKQSKINVYVETNNSLYGQLLNSDQYGMKVVHLLADRDGAVAFSQDNAAFPIGMRMPDKFPDGGYVPIGDQYVFREYNDSQGWYLYTAVGKKAFHNEMRNWALLCLGIAVVSLLFSLLLGWLVWKKVYLPLVKLNGEIRKFKASRSREDVSQDHKIRLTQVTEFDEVLLQFQEMRSHIWLLLNELMQNEEDKRYLEVEKLVAQINPHFLYNTLNTVQWLAKSNGQTEIVNLIAVFTRLMRYNLGKDGGLVKMSDEINALRDYITLQQIRYNYEFLIRMEVDPAALDVMIPRFLLQPLIENSLYHGQADGDTCIQLQVSMEDDRSVLVQVKDNGTGLDPEQIDRLLNRSIPEREKVGMGIGLNYVNTMLRVHYGESVRLQVDSDPATGTTVYFRIRKQLSEGERE